MTGGVATGGSTCFGKEGDIANHRDGDSDDDTDDERERALEDQGVFLEMEGQQVQSFSNQKYRVNNFTVYFFFDIYFSI